MWIAAEALAALGLLTATGIGLSHARIISYAAVHTGYIAPQLPLVSKSHLVEDELKPDNPPIDVPVAAGEVISAENLEARIEEKPLALQRRIINTPLPQRQFKAALPVAAIPAAGTGTGEDHASPVALAPVATAELKTIHEQTARLDARAAAVRISVQRLKAQREAAGDGLDEKTAGAYVRMNAYLSAEKSDLDDGDAGAARDHMDKAAYEVTTLEGMFGGTSRASQVAQTH